MNTFLKYWWVWILLVIVIGFYIGTKLKKPIVVATSTNPSAREKKYTCINGWEYVVVYGIIADTGRRCKY